MYSKTSSHKAVRFSIVIGVALFLLSSSAYSQKANFEALIKDADSFYVAKDYEEAAKRFGKAIKADPTQVKGWWYRADAYWKLESYKNAIKDYTKALEIEENSKFYYRRAECLLGLEKKEEACQDLQKAYLLGYKEAKPLAKNHQCAWYLALNSAPCPVQTNAVTSVEIDAFTGTIIVSKGLVYEKVTITPESGVGFLASAQVGLDEDFTFKVSRPKNFCIDADDNINYGGGFRVIDSKGTEVANVADIYAESTMSLLQEEMLKSLSMTLSMSSPMKQGEKYTLEVRYFDKRGKGELFLTLPIQIAPKNKIAKNTLSTLNTLGEGIYSSAVGMEVSHIKLKNSQNQDVKEVSSNQVNYKMELNGVKKFSSKTTCLMRWVNAEGQIVKEDSQNLELQGNYTFFNFSTLGLQKGKHKVWLKFEEADSENTMGLVLPVMVR